MIENNDNVIRDRIPWKGKKPPKELSEFPEDRAERLQKNIARIEEAGFIRPQRVDALKIAPLGGREPEELEEVILRTPPDLATEGIDISYYIAAVELYKEMLRRKSG